MCRLVIKPLEYLCRHLLNTAGHLTELNECNLCGNAKATEIMPRDKLGYPCNRCVNNKAWERKDGKWIRTVPLSLRKASHPEKSS
jgi:hypothetical protein